MVSVKVRRSHLRGVEDKLAVEEDKEEEGEEEGDDVGLDGVEGQEDGVEDNPNLQNGHEEGDAA